MTRPLVIGIGNPLRGDDGVGPRVARQLPAHMADILIVQQLTPELAEAIAAAAAVVFVDAAVDAVPGAVTCREIHTASGATGQPISHVFAPEVLLTIAAWAFDRCPPAVLVTVGAASTELSESMSPAVERAVPAALDAINRVLTINP